MQSSTVNYSNGVIEKCNIVGLESPDLLQRFRQRERDIEEKIESGEIKSATVTTTRNIGRNDLCPCGSKIKFKKCCGSRLAKDDERIKE